MRIVTFFVAASVSLLLSCGPPNHTTQTDNPNGPYCSGAGVEVRHQAACDAILPRLHSACENLNPTCDQIGSGAAGVTCCSGDLDACLEVLNRPQVDCSEAEMFCVEFVCATN